jgi:hypothetical protein
MAGKGDRCGQYLDPRRQRYTLGDRNGQRDVGIPRDVSGFPRRGLRAYVELAIIYYVDDADRP